jgi:hypothetical protein
VMKRERRPKLAVWKFASCDGCQLSLLDCEDELLAVAGEVEIANFLEASRAVVHGPYDLSLVEGSITTPHDAERIRQVRRVSRSWSPSAPAPPPGHPGAEKLQDAVLHRLRQAGVHRYARTSTPSRTTFASTSSCGVAP